MNDAEKILLKKRISGWLRQARYRARRAQVIDEACYQDVLDIYEQYEYKCAYCGNQADSPDHPFPIKNNAPCIAANVVPCCSVCKQKKHTRDLIEFYRDGHISKQDMHKLLKDMTNRKGGDELRTYLKEEYTL